MQYFEISDCRCSITYILFIHLCCCCSYYALLKVFWKPNRRFDETTRRQSAGSRSEYLHCYREKSELIIWNFICRCMSGIINLNLFDLADIDTGGAPRWPELRMPLQQWVLQEGGVHLTATESSGKEFQSPIESITASIAFAKWFQRPH